MIHEITVRNVKKTPITHWQNVPWLAKKQTITFAPGINIVFGPNGSGKSTLLAALATLMHCREDNWPRVSKSSVMSFLRPNGEADGLVLSHAGQPARFLGIEQDPGFAPEKGMTELDVILESKTMTKSLDKMSAGQATMTKLIRFLKAEPKAVQYVASGKNIGKAFHDLYEVATESLRNVDKPRGTPVQQVILLDEVDRSLDFSKQAAVWKQMRKLVDDGRHQVIIASHSPFAVQVPGARYIETMPGYLENTRKAFTLLFPPLDFRSAA